MDGVKAQLERELEEQRAKVNKTNLMLVGGTGVGKSSLINSIFGGELAQVGAGKPVSKGCESYEKDGMPLRLFDTVGYEISAAGDEKPNFANHIIPEIQRRQQLDLDKQIHLIWYCLSVGNHRITNYDLQNLSILAESKIGIPVAVVLTQCDTEEEDEHGQGKTSQAFRKILAGEGQDFPVFETSTRPGMEFQRDALLEWSADSLTDEQLKHGFIGAQRASLQLKRRSAYTAVQAAAATTAATAGLNPLPLSDSLLIVPQQLIMAHKLGRIYGFDVLGAGTMALIEGQLFTLLGRQLVASLTKLIPGVGQLINSAVAGALTFTMGTALIEAFNQAYEHVLTTGEMPDWTKILSSDNFMKLIEVATKHAPEKTGEAEH